jgi:hypothetical protein
MTTTRQTGDTSATSGGRIRPLVLIRGFGGADITQEQQSPYQGYAEGTVYPGKRGENYIYEGFLLRALKSDRYAYTDATNVVGYYADPVPPVGDPVGSDRPWDDDALGGTVVIDPWTADRVLRDGPAGTIWVYRFYDLAPRRLSRYGAGLVRLIQLIERAAVRHGEPFDGVDVVAHSMGGLVLREGLRQFHEAEAGSAGRMIHRVVTLGTPHRGIAFQRMPDWMLERLPRVEEAADEIEAFDPKGTAFLRTGDYFPLERLLTVVGTNYRTYGNGRASAMNRVAAVLDEGSAEYNRSDGLVKQSAAQVPGAPRTFIHKCHGGVDSLITSREAWEIAMRFFHGTHQVRLWLEAADISRGQDWFGRSEFFFGVAVKPRFLDFDLFHQSPEAENCYGPFATSDLSDGPPELAAELSKPLASPGDATTGWAGPDRLIWEGWIDAAARPDSAPGLVFRMDVYVGERDSRGIGFSDNVIFRKQYYVQAFTDPFELYVHTGEQYLTGTTREQLAALARPGATQPVQLARRSAGEEDGWSFDVGGTGFSGIFRLAVTAVEPAGPAATGSGAVPAQRPSHPAPVGSP